MNDQYGQQQTQQYDWQQKYMKTIPEDTGIISGQGHTILPNPRPPYVMNLTAGQPGTANISTNPCAELYTSGSENQVLRASSAPDCDTGCIPSTPAGPKPDPRNRTVKPLYDPSIYKGPVYTPYTCPNMYS